MRESVRKLGCHVWEAEGLGGVSLSLYGLNETSSSPIVYVFVIDYTEQSHWSSLQLWNLSGEEY